MLDEVGALAEDFATVITLIGLLSRVASDVLSLGFWMKAFSHSLHL